MKVYIPTNLLCFLAFLLLLQPIIYCADFTVIGGNESTEDSGAPGAWQFHKFYPNNITINAGDRIRFRTHDLEGHIIVFSHILHQFAAPDGKGGLLMDNLTFPTGGNVVDGTREISSGRLFKTTQSPYPYEWYATFPNEGVFPYYCLFHPFTMTGVVHVNPIDAKYEKTPAQNEAEIAAALESDIAITDGLAEEFGLVNNVTGTPHPNGGSVYQIVVGWGNIVTASAYMRFAPQSQFTIQVGDTVNFTQGSMHTPHGVAFNSSGTFVDLEVDQFTMGKDTIVPVYVVPTGNNTHYTGGFVSAGVFFPLDAQTGITYFTIRFMKPGVYPFMCPYHSFTGMVGTITVCDGSNCSGTDDGNTTTSSSSDSSSDSDSASDGDYDDDDSSAIKRSYASLLPIVIMLAIALMQ